MKKINDIKKKDVIKVFNEKFNVENNKEEIRIINKHQVVFYLERNVFPIRVELGFNDRLVFVFLKEDTIRTQCWEQWKKHLAERKLEKLNLYNVGACNLDDYDDYFFNE